MSSDNGTASGSWAGQQASKTRQQGAASSPLSASMTSGQLSAAFWHVAVGSLVHVLRIDAGATQSGSSTLESDCGWPSVMLHESPLSSVYGVPTQAALSWLLTENGVRASLSTLLQLPDSQLLLSQYLAHLPQHRDVVSAWVAEASALLLQAEADACSSDQLDAHLHALPSWSSATAASCASEAAADDASVSAFAGRCSPSEIAGAGLPAPAAASSAAEAATVTVTGTGPASERASCFSASPSGSQAGSAAVESPWSSLQVVLSQPGLYGAALHAFSATGHSAPVVALPWMKPGHRASTAASGSAADHAVAIAPSGQHEAGAAGSATGSVAALYPQLPAARMLAGSKGRLPRGEGGAPLLLSDRSSLRAMPQAAADVGPSPASNCVLSSPAHAGAAPSPQARAMGAWALLALGHAAHVANSLASASAAASPTASAAALAAMQLRHVPVGKGSVSLSLDSSTPRESAAASAGSFTGSSCDYDAATSSVRPSFRPRPHSQQLRGRFGTDSGALHRGSIDVSFGTAKSLSRSSADDGDADADATSVDGHRHDDDDGASTASGDAMYGRSGLDSDEQDADENDHRRRDGSTGRSSGYRVGQAPSATHGGAPLRLPAGFAPFRASGGAIASGAAKVGDKRPRSGAAVSQLGRDELAAEYDGDEHHAATAVAGASAADDDSPDVPRALVVAAKVATRRSRAGSVHSHSVAAARSRANSSLSLSGHASEGALASRTAAAIRRPPLLPPTAGASSTASLRDGMSRRASSAGVTAAVAAARDGGEAGYRLGAGGLLCRPGRDGLPSGAAGALLSAGNLDDHHHRPHHHVGVYSYEERAARIAAFHAKRPRRVWGRDVAVRYTVRKDFAMTRLRVGGRFMPAATEAALRTFISLI